MDHIVRARGVRKVYRNGAEVEAPWRASRLPPAEAVRYTE
jgi:hypothetical protein